MLTMGESQDMSRIYIALQGICHKRPYHAQFWLKYELYSNQDTYKSNYKTY